MKRMIVMSLVLLFVIVVFVYCAGKNHIETETIDEEVEEDGCREDHTQSDAPKAIESAQITSFECCFSAVPYEDADTGLDYDFYCFSAVVNGNRVSGSYQATSRDLNPVQKEFETDTVFMEALQNIVSKHDLAGSNGHFVEVKGLPDMYGADLSIIYASGENILAYDNEESFLSIAAMEAIEELFWEKAGDTGQQGEKDEADRPDILEVTVAREHLSEEVEGVLLEVTYPVLSLGYPCWDGTMRGDEGHEELKEILDTYNMTVRMNQESKLYTTLRSAAKQLVSSKAETKELYSYTDAYVTRSDERVFSFYEQITWYEWWLEEQHFWEAYNYDTQTGQLLGYEEIFTDKNTLPPLLAEGFVESYPQLSFCDGILELLEEAIREETADIRFALGHDGVHFFAADGWLSGHGGGLHIMLSYSEYPDLVKPEYRTASGDWLLQLEYETSYALEGLGNLRMSWSRPYEDGEDIVWTVSVNENTCTESLYGYPPDCYLACVSGTYLLCLDVPAGDISQLTYIYKITGNGTERMEEADLGMHSKINVDPKHILMYGNDYVFEDNIFLISYGMYRLSEEGVPVSVCEHEYGIEQISLVLLQNIQVQEVDPKDSGRVMGIVEISEGAVMTPFRTDKETYMDFLWADGRSCRFEISDFSAEMNLCGYGTLSDLFVPEAHFPGQ